MTLADRVVVMNAGRIEQVGAPNDLYHSPADALRRGIHRIAGNELRRLRARRGGARCRSAR
jgi:ABC-type sugar transport system ATPase subunit